MSHILTQRATTALLPATGRPPHGSGAAEQGTANAWTRGASACRACPLGRPDPTLLTYCTAKTWQWPTGHTRQWRAAAHDIHTIQPSLQAAVDPRKAVPLIYTGRSQLLAALTLRDVGLAFQDPISALTPHPEALQIPSACRRLTVGWRPLGCTGHAT